MKKGIVFLLLVSSVFANAQSLKDALFSGKLKTQPGTVIKKGDDLSTKMDTTQNAAYNATTIPRAADSVTKTASSQTDTAAVAASDTTNSAPDVTTTVATPVAPATNNTIWKAYIDSVASMVKTDVASSKKVKRGDYAVTVTYTIETDGQTTVSDVFIAPENDYLKQQLRSRLSADSPRLTPVLNSAGAPRKVIKRHNLTVSKE